MEVVVTEILNSEWDIYVIHLQSPGHITEEETETMSEEGGCYFFILTIKSSILTILLFIAFSSMGF